MRYDIATKDLGGNEDDDDDGGDNKNEYHDLEKIPNHVEMVRKNTKKI